MDQSVIDDALEDAATSPQEISTEAASVKMPSVSDLIALDQHNAAKTAVNASRFPLFGTKARFGGTTGET